METLSIIEHDLFSTSMLSPLDQSTLYTVTSRRHSDGYWVDVIDRIEQDNNALSKSQKLKVHTELGTVFYVNASTTRVRFRGNLDVEALGEREMEGEIELDVDAFLRRRNPYSNSRIFEGPNGVTYKWRIDGKRLELVDTTTHSVIARSHPRSSKLSFPTSFLGLTNRIGGVGSPTTSTTRVKKTARSHHPTLSLHPALLSLESDSNTSQLLDAIVLTFVIMQRLLKERLQYRYL